MLVDLTLELSAEHYANLSIPSLSGASMEGHVGTHFDVMDKTFPLSSFLTRGKLIDISHIRGREVEIADIAHYDVGEGDAVIFYTGYVAEHGYATTGYWKKNAELSDAAVEYLVDKKISLIGVDAAGAENPRSTKTSINAAPTAISSLSRIWTISKRSPPRRRTASPSSPRRKDERASPACLAGYWRKSWVEGEETAAGRFKGP